MPMIDRSAERRLLQVSGRAHAASQQRFSARVQAYLSDEPPPAPPAVLPRGVDPGIERRRCARKAVASEAQVRRRGRFNFEVALTDVSVAGCRVEMLDPCQAGDHAITRFPHLEPLGSRVCWTNGTATGMQFSTAIHPAVFDMLLSRLTDRRGQA